MDVNPQSQDTTVLPEGHRSNGILRLVYTQASLAEDRGLLP